jgi:multiple sugar transport system substrate-binding protein
MVTLNMWIWGAGTAAKQLVKQETKAFQKDYWQECKVEITLIPWQDAWSSIMKAFQEKQGPDIIQVGSTWNGTLAGMGVLMDLTREVYDANMSGELFIPAAWTSCHFPNSERISSLPWFVDIRAMYYRTDIFRQLRITEDSLDNWASFEKSCKDIKGYKVGDKIVSPLGVSGCADTLLLHNIAPWLWGAGGDFLTPDGKKAAFNSDEALNGLAFFISLVSNGCITLDTLKLRTDQIAKNFFNKGDYAIVVPGPLSDSSPLDSADPVYNPDIANNCLPSLFPAGKKGRFVFCGGSNIAVTNFSKYPDQAWQLVKFLASYDSQSRYPQTLNMFPSLLESFNGVFVDEKPEWVGLQHSWKYGRAFPNVAAWGPIETLLIDCFGKIFARVQAGDYDFGLVKKDLDEAASKADALLTK